MSASGFTPIQLFRTSTASAIPSAGTLADGELAINLTDERLYFKNAAGVVKLLASNVGSLGTVTSVAASGGTTGLTFSGSPITTSGTLTLGGTLAVANGGTGVTTSTGSVSVVLSKSPTLETPILGAATATSIANGLGAVGTPSYTFVGDTNTGMWSPSADALAFSTNGVEAMRINSSANVGIGTTSVNLSRVNVVGTNGSGFEGMTAFNSNSGTGIGGIQFGSDSTYTKAAVGLLRQDANGAGSLVFYNSGSTAAANWSTADERMRITAAGNVGIGTTSPGARLDVNAGSLGGTAGNTLDLSRFFGQTGGNQRALTTTLVRNSNGSDWTTTTMRLQAFVDVTSSTYVDFSPNGTHDLAFGSLGSERMRITSAGNVGIGTSAPGSLLQLNKGSGAADLRLSVGGTLHGTVFASSSDFTINAVSAIPLTLGTNNTERMRIADTGNVGIGTASPAARLDLNGNTAQNIVAVAALDVNCTLGNFFTKTIDANSTFTFSNPPASRAYAFTLEIVHTSGTITWPTTVRWPGNTAPTLTTGRTHLITFVTDNGGTIWYGAPQTNYLV